MCRLEMSRWILAKNVHLCIPFVSFHIALKKLTRYHLKVSPCTIWVPKPACTSAASGEPFQVQIHGFLPCVWFCERGWGDTKDPSFNKTLIHLVLEGHLENTPMKDFPIDTVSGSSVIECLCFPFLYTHGPRGTSSCRHAFCRLAVSFVTCMGQTWGQRTGSFLLPSHNSLPCDITIL